MELWEKEYRFEQAYNSGKQVRNLDKYIPNRIRDAVDETAVDSDGYWIYLADGWNVDDDKVIHAYTIADLKAAIKEIRKDQ